MEDTGSVLENINLLVGVVSGILGLGVIAQFKRFFIWLMSDMHDALNRKIDRVDRAAEIEDKILEVINRCEDGVLKNELKAHLKVERINRDSILALQLKRAKWSNSAHRTWVFWIVIIGILALYLGFLLSGPLEVISSDYGLGLMAIGFVASGAAIIAMNIGLTSYPTYGKVRKEIEEARQRGAGGEGAPA